MIKSKITDPLTGNSSEVVKKNGDPAGLVTYSRPLNTLDSSVRFATNDNFGFNLNQNASFSGTPLGVHNGTDNVYWTGSAISGSWIFDSTVQAKDGTKSINATNTTNNNEALLSTSNTDLSNYTAVTGWIYITDWSDRGTLKEVEMEFRNSGTVTGTFINLSTYINEFDLDVWQKFTIPLTDFGAATSTVNELVIRTRDIGGGPPPDYFLDVIQLEETGTPIIYEIKPEAQYGFIDTLGWVIANSVPSTVTNGTLLGLAYDNLLGVTLTNGVTVQSIRNGEEKFSANIKNLGDVLQSPGQEIVSHMSDGTNTFIKMEIQFKEMLPFNKATDDSFRIIIADDLSGLLTLRFASRLFEVSDDI